MYEVYALEVQRALDPGVTGSYSFLIWVVVTKPRSFIGAVTVLTLLSHLSIPMTATVSVITSV